MFVTVTGGAGYVGSVLVPKLLEAGHHVRVVDLCWFGLYLKEHPNLIVDRADIRKPFAFVPADAIIHLAAVANDPTGDLNPKVTWEVNALASMRLAHAAALAGVKQFIYASSGSVYGVSEDDQVTEDSELNPISEYNKTKMVAERCVLSYADRMAVQILRPATVCGFSPRMRLDVVVNLLTMLGLTKGVIAMHGGKQMRPNIHIEDMADLYLWMLERPQVTGIFNAGFENMSVAEIAKLIADKIGVRTAVLPVTDPRSYRLSSAKLLKEGFKPKKTVKDAVSEVVAKYRSGELRDSPNWRNLETMPRAA